MVTPLSCLLWRWYYYVWWLSRRSLLCYSRTTRARTPQAEVAPSSPPSPSPSDEGLSAAAGGQSPATARPHAAERRAHDPEDFLGVSETVDGDASAAGAAGAAAAAAATPAAATTAAAAHAVAAHAAAGTRVLGPATAAAAAGTPADTHVGREMSGRPIESRGRHEPFAWRDYRAVLVIRNKFVTLRGQKGL